MNVNEIFPSSYLKASDLKGRQIKVTIDRVELEILGQGKDAQTKPVIYFVGKEKGLVANKTNMNTIAIAYGDETDEWSGAEIILFEVMTDFQGKATPAIRCKIPPRAPANQRPVAQRPAPREEEPLINEDPDDRIPF